MLQNYVYIDLKGTSFIQFEIQELVTVFNLVSCGEYIFHYPAEPQDIKNLLFQQKIIGIRNPHSEMSYSSAKRLLYRYLQ